MSIILNSGQERIKNEAVDWYYNSSEQVFEIEGPAGSGKSVLIYEILKALGLKSHQYLPMAYTGQASIVMRSRGFSTARSIHSSLYEVVETPDENVNLMYGIPYKRKEFRLREFIDPNIDLFFIDEAYMVPEYMKKDILSFGKKVLVAGDSHQLPPVGDKPGFLTGYGVHRLTELMRQAKDSAIVYIANRAMQGLPIHSGMYGNQVLVINDTEFIPQMIGFADSICCGTNRTRDTLNNYIRQIAGFSNSKTPIVGERIICRNNNWNMVQDGIALTNGLSGTVVSYPDATSYNGKVFRVNFMPDLANTVFYNVPINYDYFVAPFDEKQNMKEYSNRRYMEGEFFEFSYALTTHLMQGSEYKKGIYIEEFMRPQIQNQLNYTGVTRFKEALIYVKKTNKYIYIPNSNEIF